MVDFKQFFIPRAWLLPKSYTLVESLWISFRFFCLFIAFFAHLEATIYRYYTTPLEYRVPFKIKNICEYNNKPKKGKQHEKRASAIHGDSFNFYVYKYSIRCIFAWHRHYRGHHISCIVVVLLLFLLISIAPWCFIVCLVFLFLVFYFDVTLKEFEVAKYAKGYICSFVFSHHAWFTFLFVPPIFHPASSYCSDSFRLFGIISFGETN